MRAQTNSRLNKFTNAALHGVSLATMHVQAHFRNFPFFSGRKSAVVVASKFISHIVFRRTALVYGEFVQEKFTFIGMGVRRLKLVTLKKNLFFFLGGGGGGGGESQNWSS